MQELKILNEQEIFGKSFKVYGTVENPLFTAIDAAYWIDHSNVTEMLKGINEDEKPTSVIFGEGQKRQMNMITEDGLYEVLMQSRKPIAKQFKKKVKEILKEIRTTGGYITGQEGLLDDELLERAILASQRKIAERNRVIQEKQKRIDEMRPKEIFADAVSASGSSILVRDLAKIIKQNGVAIGEKRLCIWMREHGYICKVDASPTQRAMERDYLRLL